jgi:hypothetical protein
VTSSARTSADGGNGGVSMPLPVDWPDTREVGGFDAHADTMREVGRRLRDLASAGHPGLPASAWVDRSVVGGVPALDGQPGQWATGRAVQHVHAQLREGLTAFHGALLAGLPAVAAKLEMSAAAYDRGDRAGAHGIEVAASGSLDSAPSVVGPDGRF